MADARGTPKPLSRESPKAHGAAMDIQPFPYLTIVVTAVLIAVVWIAHLQLLSAGGLSHHDEFHTLDRSAGFARQEDWFAVYAVNEVSFHKPPLQYWMTALLMEQDMSLVAALRLPSMLFALGCLIAAAAFAWVLVPSLPWAMPAAVLLLASSPQFWTYSLSAMLDVGATFFATLSLLGTVLALRRPGWWYLVAAAIVLGGLQKAPIGLILVPLFLLVLSRTSRLHGYSFAAIRANTAFRRSVWIAALGTLAWPLFQTLVHDLGALWEFFGDQMIKRFRLTGPVENPRSAMDLHALLISGEPALRWLGIAALAWLPWRLKRMELLPLPALFGFFAIVMLLAGGFVAERYTLIFVPLLAVALAVVVMSLVGQRAWIGIVAVALISGASSGPIKDASTLAVAGNPEYERQVVAISRVGAALRPEETFVACTRYNPSRIPPGLASYYGSNGRPFVRIGSMSELERHQEAGVLAGPLRGVCNARLLDEIASRLVDLEIREEHDGYIHWTARGSL